MQFCGRGKLNYCKHNVHQQYKTCIASCLRHEMFLLSSIEDFIFESFVYTCHFNVCTIMESIKALTYLLDVFLVLKFF